MVTCTKCKIEKPGDTEHFSPNHKKRNGLSSWCRECMRTRAREKMRERRADPVERIKVKEEKRRHYLSAKGKEMKVRSMARDNARQRHSKTEERFGKEMVWVWTPELWEECKARFQGCAYCGVSPEGVTIEQDHFIPLSHPDCPGTTPWNMVSACQHCNRSKGALHPRDWLAKKPWGAGVHARVAGVLTSLRSDNPRS